MKASSHSIFDYTITVTRKHRYLVVGCPEFGLQVSVNAIGMHHASPETIGQGVLKVFERISTRMRELQVAGEPVPEPISGRKLSRLKSRDLLKAREAARMLGISVSTLKRAIKSGQIRAERTPGGHLRFALEDLTAALSAFETVKEDGPE